MAYTIETVKQELPDVKVKIDKAILTGKVRGRKNNFATVYVGESGHEFSWYTITNCLNNNRPLLV